MKNNTTTHLQSSIFKYNIQFSYQKRKQNLANRKNFPSCIIQRSNSRSLLTNSYSIDSSLYQTNPITDDRTILKSLSLPLDIKTKNIDFLSQRMEQLDQTIPNKFPKRKQKGKELYFFKMLRKYTEASRLIQEQKSKTKLFQKQNETYAGIKPHLKAKWKQPQLKQRYCLNRQKKEQKFLQPVKIDPIKSLNTIKVNSLRRNI